MRLKIDSDGSTMELKTGPSHVEALTAFLEEHCDPITPSEFYRGPAQPQPKTEPPEPLTVDELKVLDAEVEAVLDAEVKA